MNLPIRRYFGFLAVWFFFSVSALPAYPPVFNYIQENDREALEAFLIDHDVNDRYGIDSITLLAYAIIVGQKNITKFLIDSGADVNLHYNSKSPLTIAVEHENKYIVKLLLKHNAMINDIDSQHNSALIYAAAKDNLPITKTLVRKGANINYKNKQMKNAYDYAISSNQVEVSKYLRNQYERHLPDFLDGPYVKWQKNDMVKTFYMVHDSTRQLARLVKNRFKAHTNPLLIKGFARDTNDYLVRKTKDIPTSQFKNVDKIMVIGDIHGRYDTLLIFLRNNGIIDHKMNWSWNNGHVVFLGDIFDRGDQVTEALWLLYHLEDQAKVQGGYVHYILGNHEIMALTQNPPYLADKYYYLCKKLNTSYSWLFNKKTILGQWLRTKNTIVKINNYLFVHAGISPEIAYAGFKADAINDLVRYYLNHPERYLYGKDLKDLILGNKGPFWYRGYIESSHYSQLDENEIDNILSYLDASKIFVGHTNVEKITPLYNYKVFIMDVPFYTYKYNMEGLLIENDTFFLINSEGKREKIK